MGLIETQIDDDWFERASDRAQALEKLQQYTRTRDRLREIWQNEPDEPTRADLGRALRRHANASKLLGFYEDALTSQDDSVAIWRELERERARVLAEIEAAEIAHLAEASDAWERFETLESVVEEEDFRIYADFYWAYRALAHCRQAEFDDGLECMQRALELRVREKRKERQLRETRDLIERIRRQQRR